ASINFMKVHQPRLDYIGKTASKTKFADSVVELDSRIGRIMDKIRALGLNKNTLVFLTTDNGAWQDVYPTPATHPSAAPRERGETAPAGPRPSPGCPARAHEWSVLAPGDKSRRHRQDSPLRAIWPRERLQRV